MSEDDLAFFFFQAEDGIRDIGVTGVQTCALPILPVVLFATLGSVLGALFFYYVGRALGPRRSHAFLDRLPLVETADVDRTFAWFERHGRSAVFFGRMRSEEHTSELQSRQYLVCRLLLEKKKPSESTLPS